MQIEGPNSSSNPLVDRRLNERGVHNKSPAEISSRSLGEIVVSLHLDLAMELPKYPGFTTREQGGTLALGIGNPRGRENSILVVAVAMGACAMVSFAVRSHRRANKRLYVDESTALLSRRGHV